MIGSDILKMLRSAFGFHVVIKWRAPAALQVNWLSSFVIVVAVCLTSLRLKIFILQSVYCMSQHLPCADVPLAAEND